GREVDEARVMVDAFPAVEAARALDLKPGLARPGERIRDGVPLERANLSGTDGALFVRIEDLGRLESAAREARPGVGCEAIEEPVGPVFGQVETLRHGIDRDCCVLEDAEGGSRLALRAGHEGVALEDETLRDLLAREPGSPRRPAACAVVGRARENGVGVDE